VSLTVNHVTYKPFLTPTRVGRIAPGPVYCMIYVKCLATDK
jgi:hypothetical protein